MAPAFPDRRDTISGRRAAIEFLTERARGIGVTAVVARPLMGKSWTLTEVARQLQDSGEFLVGYHQSTESKSSHVLQAVSDLYGRWLADSSMRAQALSLWQRYKGTVVSGVGQAIGVLFKALGGGVTSGISDMVSATFSGLAEAQKSLVKGGLETAPLPYNKVRSVTELAAGLSGRRVVLILDAWEHAPSLRSDARILELLLEQRDSWPVTHVMLGVRASAAGVAPNTALGVGRWPDASFRSSCATLQAGAGRQRDRRH